MNPFPDHRTRPRTSTSTQLELFTQQTAAIKIQQAWKRHQQKKEYKSIRDLIYFHNEGKPQDLIRSVAQSESFLCDGATRLFVRFRLQGKTFPPQIVYKIFTNSNVCDVNAFGPRNYNGELKMKLSEHRYQKYFPQLKHEKSLSNLKFYERKENNPWRPIIAEEIMELKRSLSRELSTRNMHLDRPGTRVLKKYVPPFHHSTLQRRDDRRLRLKRKKLKMLQRLYKIGLATPRPMEVIEEHRHFKGDGHEMEKEEEKTLNHDTTDELQKEVNQEIIEKRLTQRIDSKSNLKLSNEEQDIEDLLEWSHSLDFTEYLVEWGSLGTSADYTLFMK